jgi:hypothetical protein
MSKRSQIPVIDTEKDLDHIIVFLNQYADSIGDMIVENKHFLNDKDRVKEILEKMNVNQNKIYQKLL